MAKKRKPSSIRGEQRPDTHSEGEKYGTPRAYDPHFRGPVVNRSCTDVLCCMIFMLFIMAYILLGLAAWVNGDPRRVAYPTDSQGYFCGQKGTPNENKSILFYFNLLTCTSPSVVVNLQCPTTQICVSKCPERFLTYMEIQFKYKNDSKYWTYYSQFCRTTFLKPVETLSQVLLDNDCPSAIYPSKPFLQRCFPDFSTKNGTITVGNKTVFDDGSGKTRNAAELRIAANGINKALDARAIGVKVFEDYATTWYWILIGLTIAMLLSWMFVMLLRFTAGLLFWIFTFGVIGIIAYGIWRCYLEYSRLQEHPDSQLNVYTIGIQTDISMYFRLKQTWFALSSMVILLLSFKDLRHKINEMIESAIGKVKRVVILCLLELFIILMLIFLRDRIRISIALLKEGSKAIGYIPSTLIYPALTFFFLSVCISYWGVVALYLATSGAPVYKVIAPQGRCEHENKTCDPVGFNTTGIAKACPGAQCHFAFYGGKSLYHQYITTFQLLNLFVFLWLINFVIALGQCALAGAFASYYWALKKPDDIPPYPLFTAFGRAIRYHTGSLAFGSLILAIIQMFRLILEYMDKRLQKAQSNISKFLKCCLRCCFWCLEKAVKFLNRNAYVMMAIYGKNFCKSARDAFNLLMRNILKIAVMDRVTDFVLILGKILVAGCIGVLAFLLFTERLPVIIEGPTSLNYYWVPLLTVIVGSYIIAHGFFSVYAMCIETIFICFLEDLERNDGSAERPYYMSQSLMKIMNKRNVETGKQ